MNDDNHTNELRFKRGRHILSYIHNFSATEKFIFGACFITAIVSAIIMALWINNYYSVDVPAYGGVLNEGIIGLPRNINPILAVTDADRDLSALIYSGLTKYVDGKIIPDLAQSYTVSPDGLTYDFKLKPRVSFQDGTTLTTADIAFTIKKIQDPAIKSPRRIDWTDVTVHVISPTEIQFNLKKPYSPFITNTTIGILPEHIWGSVNNDQFIFSQYNTNPVGSGPYRISSISHDGGGIPTNYVLSSWRRYYGMQPYISSITLNFFADEVSALSALDRGSIDSLPAVSPEAAYKLGADSAQSYEIISKPLPRIFAVFFNQNQSSVLSDKIVRRALDLATDRQSLIDTVLKGYGTAIQGPNPFIVNEAQDVKISTSTTTHTSTSTDDTSSLVSAAQSLLEKNGWKKGADGIYAKKSSKTAAPVTLSFDLYTADSPDLRNTANILRDTWNSLGAQVTVKIYESADLYQNVIRTRSYDALLFGEAVGKDRDLYAFWHSSQRNAPGLNVALYTNSKADKLLEDIRSTNDAATRANSYTQFDQLIRADIPAIFLYMPDFIYAIPKKLRGLTFASLSMPADRWSGVSSWYEETESVWRIFINK